MKNIAFIIGIILLLFACSTGKKEKPSTVDNSTNNIKDSTSNFFPVTTYLKGEIFEIKNGGITPLHKITVGTKVDSAWIKMEDLENYLTDFLTPIIDTANLKNLFIEKRFLDQTIDAFTFTYDPKNEKGLAFPFTHWDVYINPVSGKVQRVYLVKKIPAGRELQLTWLSGKYCKTVTLLTQNGKTTIVKEEKTIWRFDQ